MCMNMYVCMSEYSQGDLSEVEEEMFDPFAAGFIESLLGLYP